MVGLVQNEQSAGAEVAQPVTQTSSISLVDEEPVGNEET